MSQINFCSQCGAPLTDANANFCSQCGYKFVRAAEIVPDSSIETLTAQGEGAPIDSGSAKLVNNSYFSKYARAIGVFGILLSTAACAILIGIYYHLCSSSNDLLSFLDIDSNFLPNHIIFLVLTPLAFVLYKQLRNFANAQTTHETTISVRKISIAVLLTIICGTANSIASLIPLIDGRFFIFINVLCIGLYINNLLFTLSSINKIKNNHSTNDAIHSYLLTIKSLTYTIIVILSLILVLELLCKICLFTNNTIFDIVCKSTSTISTILHIVMYIILIIASFFTIFKLGRNAPEVTPEQLAEIKARL